MLSQRRWFDKENCIIFDKSIKTGIYNRHFPAYTGFEVITMRTSLAKLPAPALAGVVRERTAAAAIVEIKNCLCDGAVMIDLHLSCLDTPDEETLTKIIGSTSLPILALNYNGLYDWSPAGYDEDARVESLLRAIDCGAAGVDMQGYTFDIASKTGFHGDDVYSFTKGNPREIVTDPAIIEKQCDLIEQVHAKGGEVLLSCHPGVAMKAETVVELALFLEQRKPDIIKIVTTSQTDEDLLESIRAMLLLKKEVKTPVSYHANGKAGALSRILNPVLGGQIVFCVDRFSDSSTMEQLHLPTAKAAVDALKKLM